MAEASDLAARLVGAWRLVSMEARSASGVVDHPWGHDVDGRLTYDAQGRMSLQIVRLPRARFASDDLEGGTPAEIQAAFDTYHAYFGRYAVDTEAGTVTHEVEGSLFPNWSGESQTRRIELQAGRLTLASPPMPYGGEARSFVSVWERLG